VHEVRFTAYPKLFFTWPLIVLGLVFWPISGWVAPDIVHGPAGMTPMVLTPEGAAAPGMPAVTEPAAAPPSGVERARLELLGWIYIWVIVLVLLTLGVDVDRNKAVFFIVLIAAIYLLGLWLHDTRGFTFFGDIYRWFARLDVQYDRSLGLAMSLVLLVPFLLLLVWARLNDRWRITHNEFEHYSLGKANDSLGRGAKTIRTDFPDVFELLLGLAGTLIVFNASGTRELRRIPHIMFLPFVRRRLNQILERTAVTAGEMEEEEEEET
jgi:hypothetical protein